MIYSGSFWLFPLNIWAAKNQDDMLLFLEKCVPVFLSLTDFKNYTEHMSVFLENLTQKLPEVYLYEVTYQRSWLFFLICLHILYTKSSEVQSLSKWESLNR